MTSVTAASLRNLFRALMLPAVLSEPNWNELRPHPRLGVFPVDRKPDSLSTSTAQLYLSRVRAVGEKLLHEPVAQRILCGHSMLETSRLVLLRVYTLSALLVLDGEQQRQQWLVRLKEELFAASAFSDWHPSVALDTAEMMHAVAVGYDLLYAQLDAGERKVLCTSLIEKGLIPAMKAFDSGAPWTVNGRIGRSNWNIVCNASVISAALAVADEERSSLTRSLLTRALRSIRFGFDSYAPDGAWHEGAAYWRYATDYAAVAIRALKASLGSDFELSTSPGFPETGKFILHMMGPSGAYFNFGDAQSKPGSLAVLFWLGRRFNDPSLLQAAKLYHSNTNYQNVSAHDLIWYDARDDDAGTASPKICRSLDAYYTRTNIATFRSAWDDRKALYFAVKGGDNSATHTHLDLGTFVLDSHGYRWAVDHGPEKYTAPAYFGDQRWNYYRARTEGHNTITIGGRNQLVSGTAGFSSFSSGDNNYAILNLTAAYPEAKRLIRGVAMSTLRSSILLQDEIDIKESSDVCWAMHTHADIKMESNSRVALLSHGSLRLIAKILSPPEALFHVQPIMLLPPNSPLAPTACRLRVDLVAATTTLAVLFIPCCGDVAWQTVVASSDSSSVRVIPLHRWKTIPPFHQETHK